MAVHLIVFGFGQQCSSLNVATALRVGRAVSRARELQEQNKRVGSIVLPTGVGTEGGRITMASTMECYARELFSEQGKVSEKEAPLLVNKEDHSVWGTERELLWAAKEIYRLDPYPVVEFVTNRRHGWRVLHANKLFGHFALALVTPSSDAESAWWHEGLGYVKLYTSAFGPEWLTNFTENIRRKHYTAG